MAKPELGLKRLCPSCGAKYYDLNRNPILCPKCGAQFDAGLAARRFEQAAKGWKPAQPRPRKVSAALKAYALLATSADKGAVRDKALLDAV